MTMKKVPAIWLLLLIILVSVGLRSLHLESRSLWFDEAFSWRLIQFPISEMITRDIADVHPPLYYVLLKGWAVVFGDSGVALRSFSVAMAAIAVGLTYGFSTAAFGKREVGLVAALLVAISGLQIQVGEEARMYTLGTVGAVACAWLLLKVVRESSPVWLWATVYGVAVALFAYVHYYAFFSIAAQAIFAAIYLLVATRGRLGEVLQWPLTWRLSVAGLLAAILYIPWIPHFLQQRAQVQAAFWIPPLDRWSVPDTAYRMIIPALSLPRFDGGWWILVSLAPLALLLVIILGLALQSLWRPSRAIWLTLAGGVLPIALAVGVSMVSQSVYQDRYLVFAHIFLLIAAATLLAHLRPPMLRRSIVALVVLGMLVAQGHYWRQLAIDKAPGVRGAATALFGERAGGEAVVVSSPFIFFSLLHYAQEVFEAPDVVKLFATADDVVHFAGGPVLVETDVVGSQVFVDPGSRVLWAVDTSGFGGSELRVPAPWRASATWRYPEVFGYQGDIIVTRYQR